jgi:hypothetical protein
MAQREPNKNNKARRAQSPELSAGAGFTFEDAVSATFLSALVAEGYAPGISNATVSRVALQQRSFKEPLDDVIVDFRDIGGATARLGLQVKRALTISAAKNNTDFREVIRDCWATLHLGHFRKKVDRYGVAVGEIAKDRARDFISLCEAARESQTTEHFSARFAQGGNASTTLKAVKEDIVSLLSEVKGSEISEAETYEFLAHFVLQEFDFLHDGAVDPPEVMSGLRDCLAAADVDQAPALWTTLRQTARNSAGKSGEFDRPRLVRELARLFHLRAAPSLRGDLEKITAPARDWVADIQDDVGGTRLSRAALSVQLEAALAEARFIQIRGLAGSGKSVLLRRRVESALGGGPVLFLKSVELYPNFVKSLLYFCYNFGMCKRM